MLEELGRVLIVVCLRLWVVDGTDTEPDDELVPRREVVAEPKLYPRFELEPELELLLITVPRLVRTPFTELLPLDEEDTLVVARRPTVLEAEVEAVPTVARRPVVFTPLPDDTTLPP